MSEKKIYPKGIMAFPPHEKAPSFVKGSIVITPRQLVDWIKENPALLMQYKEEKQLRLQLTQGQDGKLSLSVDTWKPNSQAAPKKEEPKDDLPF